MGTTEHGVHGHQVYCLPRWYRATMHAGATQACRQSSLWVALASSSHCGHHSHNADILGLRPL